MLIHQLMGIVSFTVVIVNWPVRELTIKLSQTPPKIKKLGQHLRTQILDFMILHKRRYQRMLNLCGDSYPPQDTFINIEDHIEHMRNTYICMSRS